MDRLHARVCAVLAAAWEGEVLSTKAMSALATRMSDGPVRARLFVLSAVCQIHASRLLSRLGSYGSRPLPVPSDELNLPDDLAAALRQEAGRALADAERYSTLATTARRAADASAAWVCELNGIEERERGNELLQLAERLASEAVSPSASAP